MIITIDESVTDELIEDDNWWEELPI